MKNANEECRMRYTEAGLHFAFSILHSPFGMAAGDGLAPPSSPSKGGVLLIRRPGSELVEPEVVATSPYPIKSRVPVCCGFSSRKNGGRERTCTSKAHRFSICGVCYPL